MTAPSDPLRAKFRWGVASLAPKTRATSSAVVDEHERVAVAKRFGDVPTQLSRQDQVPGLREPRERRRDEQRRRPDRAPTPGPYPPELLEQAWDYLVRRLDSRP
jgi:hypothetical protein